MRNNKIILTGLGVALAFGLTTGTGVAGATTPTAPTAPTTPTCAAATQELTNAQARLAEATPTRTLAANEVTAQKAARQNAINAGNVALVGQINVQLGSSTATFTTTDGAVAGAQARLVRAKAAKIAAC
jgi:hypothetical protein